MPLSEAAVTPVLLTFNEEANIGRTLRTLASFRRVVILDSVSSDRTESIARSFKNVAWFSRPFEGHLRQWERALAETGIDTPFVLALDADMALPHALLQEIERLVSKEDVDGAFLKFEYRIRGVPLSGSVYPPQLRLMRTTLAVVVDAGHTQEFRVHGKIARLSTPLIHDDRKPLERFVISQLRYSALELPRLSMAEHGRKARSRFRRAFPFAPHVIWLYSWLRAGGPFGGSAARRYALERLIYESLLRWRVEDALLVGSETPPSKGSTTEENAARNG